MLGTVALDAAGGMLPVVGPVVDAVVKTNKWNVELILEELLPEEEFGPDTDEEPVVIEVE